MDFLFLNLRQSLHLRAKNDFAKIIQKKIQDCSESFEKNKIVKSLNRKYLGLIDLKERRRENSRDSIRSSRFENFSGGSARQKIIDSEKYSNANSIKNNDTLGVKRKNRISISSSSCDFSKKRRFSKSSERKNMEPDEIYSMIKKFILSPNQVYREKFREMFEEKVVSQLKKKWVPRFIRQKRSEMKRCVKALQSLFRNLDRLGLINFDSCVEIFDQSQDENLAEEDFLENCQELLEVSKFLFLKKIISNGYIPRRFCTNMGDYYLSLKPGIIQDRVYLKFFSSPTLDEFFSYEVNVPDFTSLFSRLLKLLQELLKSFKSEEFSESLALLPTIQQEKSVLKRKFLGCEALCPTCNRRCQCAIHMSSANVHHQTVHIDHSLLTACKPSEINKSQKLESLQLKPKLAETKDTERGLQQMTPKHSCLKESQEMRRQSRRVLKKLMNIHKLPEKKDITHDITNHNSKQTNDSSPFFNKPLSRLSGDWNWDFLPPNKNLMMRERLAKIWEKYGERLLSERPNDTPHPPPRKNFFFYGDVKNFCGSYAHRNNHFEFLLAPDFKEFLSDLQKKPKAQQAYLRMPFLNASNGFSTVFYAASGLLKPVALEITKPAAISKIEVLSKSRPSELQEKFEFTLLADFVLEDSSLSGAEEAVFVFLFRGLFEFDERRLAEMGRLKRSREKPASAIFFYDYLSLKKLKVFAHFLNMPVRLCKLDLGKKNKFEQLVSKF